MRMDRAGMPLSLLILVFLPCVTFAQHINSDKLGDVHAPTASLPEVLAPPRLLGFCIPDGATLCLQAGRFAVTLAARDQRSGRTGNGRSIPQNDLFGYFSLPDLTNDPSNPEVFVKLLDGRAANGKFWVFYGGLTDLEYTLTVRDTTNNAVRSYFKKGGEPCGGFDTGAFAMPPDRWNSTLGTIGGSRIERDTEEVAQAQFSELLAGCVPSVSSLCLNSSRFRVSLQARDPRSGKIGNGVAIPQNNLFGYFSIPDLTSNADNPEVFVKLLDGRSANGRFWVFYGSLTDFELNLLVTDTANGLQHTFVRPGGSACGGFDTGTFYADPGNYILLVGRGGSGSGTVNGTGITCGTDCTESFAAGTYVNLTATPTAGSSFSSWDGCDFPSGTTCTEIMNTNKTVTALFAGSTPQYTLTVTKSGNGTGTVSGTGISCGNDCSETFALGTSVTLTAVAAASSSFAGWSGCDLATANSCNVSMNSNRAVVAAFNTTAINYTLAVTKSGTGAGTVTGAGISCGADCTEVYGAGTVVTLTASPSATSTFEGWSGCDTANGASCNVTMSSSRSVTASFTAVPANYTLTVTKSGNGSGAVGGPGIDCGPDCSETYAAGTRVNLTALAASGSTFVSFSGCTSATASTCTVDMTANRTIVATFNLVNASCTRGAERCVTGNVTVHEVCSDAGQWVQSPCGDWRACVANSCRLACDITAPEAYPTACFVPYQAGASNGIILWNNGKMAVPTYVQAGAYEQNVNASVYNDSSAGNWPYIWSISSPTGIIGFNFKLNQFTTGRVASLTYRVQRAGLINESAYINAAAFNATTALGSCPLVFVSLMWMTSECHTPATYAFNYTGGWNGFLIGVTNSGFSNDYPDLVDVNWLKLTIK